MGLGNSVIAATALENDCEFWTPHIDGYVNSLKS
jgi:hypothetical protein